MTSTTPGRSAGAGRTDWRQQAACRSLDPDLFFPVSTSGASLSQIETARCVCERCPVRTACLRWALDAGQVSGIGEVPGEPHLSQNGPGTPRPWASPDAP